MSHLQSLHGSLQRSLDKTIQSSLGAMKAEMAQQFETFVQSYTPESEQRDELSIHVSTGQQPSNSFGELPMSINPHGHPIVPTPVFSFTIPPPPIQVPLGGGGPQTREPLWHIHGPSHDVHSQSQERFSCLSERENPDGPCGSQVVQESLQPRPSDMEPNCFDNTSRPSKTEPKYLDNPQSNNPRPQVPNYQPSNGPEPRPQMPNYQQQHSRPPSGEPDYSNPSPNPHHDILN